MIHTYIFFFRQRLSLRLGVNIDDQLCLCLYPNLIPDPNPNTNPNRRHAPTADSNSSSELAFSYPLRSGNYVCKVWQSLQHNTDRHIHMFNWLNGHEPPWPPVCHLNVRLCRISTCNHSGINLAGVISLLLGVNVATVFSLTNPLNPELLQVSAGTQGKNCVLVGSVDSAELIGWSILATCDWFSGITWLTTGSAVWCHGGGQYKYCV